MAYSDITFRDKNLIKSWLQSRRLMSAAKMAGNIYNPEWVIDFGAGNGELCKTIALKFPKAKIICYEPTPSLLEEAKENLSNIPHVKFYSELKNIPKHSIDLVFCLEVFEHLPEKQTEKALNEIRMLLKSNGCAVIGVPIETGIPALYKGMFRMTRRFGSFDASIKNVLSATLFNPPKNRPVSEIAPGFSFHFEHMGFDHRKFKKILKSKFILQKSSTSPFPILGSFVNTEANFLIKK